LDGDSKKIYEHKRKRGFIDSWSKDFDGLQDSSDGMIYTYCKKFPNIAGTSISVLFFSLSFLIATSIGP
jgi:uncharacterized UPF0160 family protein